MRITPDLYRSALLLDAQLNPAADQDALRTLVRAAERRRDDALRQVMDAERELMRWQDALTAALDRQAREQRPAPPHLISGVSQ